MGGHTRKSTAMALAGLCIFAAGFLGASLFMHAASERQPAENESYPLLARRLFMDNPNDIRINFSPLRTSLRTYFKENNLQGSLYFEYLPTGVSVRVNPTGQYRAASLIKLPVAMELYKGHELGKIDLDKKVALKSEWLNSGYGTLYKKGAGYTLTLEEAAKIMLTESDNTALQVLIDANRDLGLADRALGSLDIEFTAANDGAIDIGTRSYASFLKCLYFACYNNREDSQTILDLLTETAFNKRLVAGVQDKRVKIAHKIGVFNNQIQSDCGIVYLPARNYALCIMLLGNDDATTNNHIAALSKLTYTFVKN